MSVPRRHSAARHDPLSQQKAELSRLQHTTILQGCRHVTAVLRVLLLIGGVELNPGPNTSPQSPDCAQFLSAFTSPILLRTPPSNQPSPSASLPWLRDHRSSSFSRSITGSHRGSHPSARSSLESSICFSDTESSPITPNTVPRATDVTPRQTTTMAHDAHRLFDPFYVQNSVTSTFSSASPSTVAMTSAPRWTYLSSPDQMTLPATTSSTTSSTGTSRPSNAARHFGWTYLSTPDQMTLPAYTTATTSSTTSSTGTSRPSNAPRHFGWTYLSTPDQMTTYASTSTVSTATSRINTVNKTPSTNINQLISSLTSQLSSTISVNSNDSNQLNSTPIMSTTTQSNTLPLLNEASASTTSPINRMPPQHCSNVVPAMSSQVRTSPVRNQSNARPDLYQQALRNATRTMQQMSFPSTDFQITRINSSSSDKQETQMEVSNEPETQSMREGNASNSTNNTTSFRTNPFYEPVMELLELTVLENGKRSDICTNSLCAMQRNMYTQNLSSFNYSYTCLRFKLDLGSEIFQVNSKQMVQLRLCRLNAGAAGPYEDNLPSELQIKVNNQNIILPLPELRNGEFCIPAQPINLKPHYLKIGETSQHLVVTWKREPKDYENSAQYGISVNIVKKLEPEEALSHLSCSWSKDRTESKIREIMQASALDEVAATALRISLICPLSMVRIKTPVRFQSCRHLQCVDALALLRMNELSYGWRCPICNVNSSYHELHVDQYFVDVLTSPLLPSSCSEIELQENGSWKPYCDPKVQDLDYRFNMSLNDSVVEITNRNNSAETPNKCDMNQSVVVTYEKPAPFTRMNTNLLIERNLKALIADGLSPVSSQGSQKRVQSEEDPYNFSLYLDMSDEAMENTTPDNRERELNPTTSTSSSTNRLSSISFLTSDSELSFQPTPEKVQETADVTETTGVNLRDEIEAAIAKEHSFSFDEHSTEKVHELPNETAAETSTRSVDTNELSFLGDATEHSYVLSMETDLAEISTHTVDTNELSFLGDATENVHESSNEKINLAETSTQSVDINQLSFLGNVHEPNNETDLAETSTQSVDTNDLSYLGNATGNVHEPNNETDLAETSTQSVDTNELSFLGNVHDPNNETDLAETSTQSVDTNAFSFLNATENVHDSTNETDLAETSTQIVDLSESLGAENNHDSMNEGTSKQSDATKTTKKAPKTTKKQVTKKKPQNVVPPKKTNRKAKKIVTFVISSDDSEDDDPTHKQRTTVMNSSPDHAPHRPFTRSQARRAGKKN